MFNISSNFTSWLQGKKSSKCDQEGNWIPLRLLFVWQACNRQYRVQKGSPCMLPLIFLNLKDRTWVKKNGNELITQLPFVQARSTKEYANLIPPRISTFFVFPLVPPITKACTRPVIPTIRKPCKGRPPNPRIVGFISTWIYLSTRYDTLSRFWQFKNV